MAVTSYRESFKQLLEIAEAQGGFFTPKQAKDAGFDERNHPYHVRVGNWVREHRGIYRLAYFPPVERPDLILWSLWSRDRRDVPQGVYSHQTALAIHDLSDLMPAKLHMTVPKSFRRNSEVPDNLALHRADLLEKAIEERHGYRVTRPLQTLIDLLVVGDLPRDILQQALREGLQRGSIQRSEIVKTDRSSPAKRQLLELYQETIGEPAL